MPLDPEQLLARQKELLGLEGQRWIESQVNKGMVTVLDPSNLPTGALQLAKNARVRYDRTLRREGSLLLTVAKPDANPVLKLVFFKNQLGTSYTLRLTPSTAQLLANGAWAAFTIAAGLHGTQFDYMQVCDVLNTLVLANNGADVLQKIDPSVPSIAALGNAPAYRYVTGFFNRAVGANLRGTSEVQVGWSGDGNVAEWNPVNDQTAGNTPLLDSPADLSDFITGLNAFSSVMFVMRERSVWLANKQPIPTNPFYFYNAVPGIGCDCPFSIQLTKAAIAWLDTRSRSVWAYAPGMGEPTRIGEQIENQIIANVNDPKQVFSAYSTQWDEYTIYIPSVSSNVVQGWTYNFRSQAWTYNEYINLTSVSDVDFSSTATRIMDLVGAINNLLGNINGLSPTTVTQPNLRTFGFSDGTISTEDASQDTDAGTDFETQLVSKSFKLPSVDTYIAKVMLEYECQRPGTFVIEYSKTGGAIEDWVTAKTISAQVVGKPVLAILRRMVRSRRYAWRVRTTAGAFDFLSYELQVYPGGAQRGS